MTHAIDAAAARRLVRYVIVVAMAWSVVVLAGIAAWGGDAVRARLATIGMPLVFATLATFALNHGLRFVRWHLMLRAERHFVPWRRSLAIFMAGLALLPTPAKAGVASRSVLLLAEGVPAHVSIAAYFAERLLDLVGLVMLATLLLATLSSWNAWMLAAFAGVAGMVAVAVAPAMLAALRARMPPWPRTRRALDWTSRCFVDAEEMLSGWRLPAFVVLGMAANAIAGLLLYAALLGSATPIAASTGVGILSVSHLSGSISLLPGGIGGFDLAMLAQLAAGGVAPLDALVALSLVRIATLWSSVVVGLPLLWVGMRRVHAR